MGALYTSIVLGILPVPAKLYRESVFESVHQGVTKRKLADGLRDLGFTVSQTHKISQVGFVCIEAIRLEAPELDFFY